MRTIWRLLGFGLGLTLIVFGWDILWMKASDYEIILPREIASKYALVKLLMYWIPIAMGAAATFATYMAGAWSVVRSRRSAWLLSIALLGCCLAVPLIADIATKVLGCFVYYTYFQACI